MRRLLLGCLVLGATAGIVSGAFFGGLPGDDVLWPLTWVAWAPVGALILVKRPGNGVGRAMLSVGVSWGISFAFLAIAAGNAPLQVRVWAELVNTVSGVAPWLGVIWLLLVFPTGTLAGRLEKFTARGLALVALLAVLAFAGSPVPMVETGTPSPLATSVLESVTGWFVGESGFLLVLALLVAAVVLLARRWRRSSGVERHQYRWLLSGAILFGAILTLAQWLPDDSPALFSFFVAGAAIPVSVGVAVSRYRLFEIDRIISRTLAYTIVVVLLGVLYVGLVTAISSQMEGSLAVAASTLAVAALFNPLRKWVQGLVDRRFNRSSYDTEKVMVRFAGSLRDEVDADEVIEGWVEVVEETMQPSAVGIWVRQ